MIKELGIVGSVVLLCGHVNMFCSVFLVIIFFILKAYCLDIHSTLKAF